jgi:hypothetical protein
MNHFTTKQLDSDVSGYRLACRNNTPPPAREIKTGPQAARRGAKVPLTPSELKLKLKT